MSTISFGSYFVSFYPSLKNRKSDKAIDNSFSIPYNIFITFVIVKGGSHMRTLPQISEAEFEVMKIVWKHAPISTNEITEKLT